MAHLMNKTRGLKVADVLKTASTHRARAVGLLGKKFLSPQEALWITSCRSIHTFFMKFPIDVAFVDRHLRVQAVYSNVGPWRVIIPPMWKVSSVFEFASGVLKNTQTEIGDQFDVVDESP